MKKEADHFLAQRQNGTAFLFLLPSLLAFIVFILIPIITGIIISFSDYGGFQFQFHFLGLKNYFKLFHDDYFKISILNNLIYSVAFVPLTIFASLLAALAVNSVRCLKNFFHMAFYFPQVASMVSVSMIWCTLFHPTFGPINSILRGIGIKTPPEWLLSPHWAMAAIVMVSVWKNFGYYMIILLAGLQGIPDYLYESATLDGAGRWGKFKYITLPTLSPTLFIVSILTIIYSFQVFDLVKVMTDGGPGRATNVLVYRIYQEAFENCNVGYASSMAVILFLIIFVITLVQFRFEKKWVNY